MQVPFLDSYYWVLSKTGYRMMASFAATAHDRPQLFSAVESARYTKDMLENLRRIALRQEQIALAHLLEAAAREADRLLRLG